MPTYLEYGTQLAVYDEPASKGIADDDKGYHAPDILMLVWFSM